MATASTSSATTGGGSPSRSSRQRRSGEPDDAPPGGRRRGRQNERHSSSTNQNEDGPKKSGERRKQQGGGGEGTWTKKEGPSEPPTSFADILPTLVPQELFGSGSGLQTAEALPQACVLCSNPLTYAGIGKCADRLCWVCTIRLRVLRKSSKCPYCSEDLPKVLVSRKAIPYLDIDFRSPDLIPGPNGLYYGDEVVAQAAKLVQELRCWYPKCRDHPVPFPNQESFSRHLLSQHQKVFCDTCLQARQKYAFWCEQMLYSPGELLRHKKLGDAPIQAPHKYCSLCNKWLFDETDYMQHYRQEHLFCRLCEQDGVPAFFRVYDQLYAHFDAKHYPCPEKANCTDVVFRNEFDLRIHIAKEHPALRSQIGATRRGLKLDIFSAQQSDPGPSNRRGLRGGDSSRFPAEEEPEEQPADVSTARWPLPMLAQAGHISALLRKDAFEPTSDTKGNDRACFKALKSFCDDEDIERCKEELAGLNKGHNSPDEFLGRVSLILYRREQFWQRQQNDSLGEPEDWSKWRVAEYEIVDPFGSARKRNIGTVCLSPAAEVLYFIVRGAPNPKKEELATVVERIGVQSESYRVSLDRSPEPDGVTTPSDESTNGIPCVLGTDDSLPIGPKVPFIEALQWAIIEFNKKVMEAVSPESEFEDPGSEKLPSHILDRIRSEYAKGDLELIVHLVVDLSDFVPTRELERILGLRPWYELHKARGKPRKIEVPFEDTIRIVDAPPEVAREWGKVCDRAFAGLTLAKHRNIIKQYIEESRRYIPLAMPVAANFRSLKAAPSAPSLNGSQDYPELGGLNSRTWTRPTRSWASQEEAFPALRPATSSSAAGARQPESRGPWYCHRCGHRNVALGAGQCGACETQRARQSNVTDWNTARAAAAPKRTTPVEPKSALPTSTPPPGFGGVSLASEDAGNYDYPSLGPEVPVNELRWGPPPPTRTAPGTLPPGVSQGRRKPRKDDFRGLGIKRG